MLGNLVPFPSRRQEQWDIKERIQRALAILQAIDEGELLAALPDCEISRANHLSALELLAVAEGELKNVFEALEG